MKKIILYVLLATILAMSVSANGIKASPPGLSPGRLAIVQGTVYDLEENPVQGVQVDVWCENAESGKNKLIFKNLVTNADGGYSAWTMGKPQCRAGDEAWIEVEYEGATYTSERIKLANKGAADIVAIDATVGVPEYTTLTLGAAVIIAGLGLVLLKRKN